MEGYWSLVGFTILAQAAAGLMMLCPFIADESESRTQGIVAVALLAMSAGLSLAHLSDPVRSVFTILNILDSWLSREIMCLGLFGGSTLIAIIKPQAAWRWLSAVTGLLFVFVMGNVYVLAAVPTWNSWLTVAAFMTTALLLGASLGLCLTLLQHRANPDSIRNVLLGWYPPLLILALAMRMALVPLQSMQLAPANPCLYGIATHVVLSTLGAALGVLLLTRHRLRSAEPSCPCGYSVLAVVSTLLVFGGEVTGRALFYASYMTAGLN